MKPRRKSAWPTRHWTRPRLGATCSNKVVGEADVRHGRADPDPRPAGRTDSRTSRPSPGQIVPANAPLFEVMDLDEVWVRVPVYVGELADTDTTGPRESADFPPQRPARPAPARSFPRRQWPTQPWARSISSMPPSTGSRMIPAGTASRPRPALHATKDAG